MNKRSIIYILGWVRLLTYVFLEKKNYVALRSIRLIS